MRSTRTVRGPLRAAAAVAAVVAVSAAGVAAAEGPQSTPPDTPLLAGRPTRSIQAPAASYMPHMAIIDRTCCAVSSRTTRAPERVNASIAAA